MNTDSSQVDNRPKATPQQLVTREDLLRFKKEVVSEVLVGLRELLCQPAPGREKKWLKTREVRKKLGISPGTLQTLRDKGIIAHSRIGRLFYYDPDDIDKELERRKSFGRNHTEQLIRDSMRKR